ncbi:MAG: hypothetical protein ACRDQB_08660 [Thermocrispum sp.]
MFWWFWIAAGVVLLPFTALWVYARRRFCVVRVTGDELTQGAETLPVDQITQVSDASSADHELLGDRVLGGGQAVPRKYQPVRLGLSDDTRVLAWARDGDALRTALRRAAGA